jgi:hypothetical protein
MTQFIIREDPARRTTQLPFPLRWFICFLYFWLSNLGRCWARFYLFRIEMGGKWSLNPSEKDKTIIDPLDTQRYSENAHLKEDAHMLKKREDMHLREG